MTRTPLSAAELAQLTPVETYAGGGSPARLTTPNRDHLACVHLLDSTADTVEQIKCGCPGSKHTTVWECELKTRCAPLAVVASLADPTVTACLACDRYQPHPD